MSIPPRFCDFLHWAHTHPQVESWTVNFRNTPDVRVDFRRATLDEAIAVAELIPWTTIPQVAANIHGSEIRGHAWDGIRVHISSVHPLAPVAELAAARAHRAS